MSNATPLSRPAARRLPWLVLLVFFLFPVFHEGFHRPLSDEESETLPYAKHFAQPDYVVGDWYFERPQPVRRPYQVLVYPLVKWLPLPAATLIARFVGYLLLAGALTLIALRLRIGVLEAGLIIGAFLWLDQSLPPGEDWLFKKTESKVFAYALILFALAATLAGRLRSAGLLAGLATTLHIIIGGWGTVALALSVLSARVCPGWRVRLQSLACWIAGGAGALYFVAAKLAEPPASARFDFEAIYVEFRMPHHLLPSAWRMSDDDIWLALLGIALIALMFRIATTGKERAAAVPAHFALWSALPYGLGFVAMLLPFGTSFLHYYPFRFGTVMVLILGLMLAVPRLLRLVVREQARVWVMTLAVAVFAAGAVQNAASDVEELIENPHGGRWRGPRTTARLQQLCTWVKANTAPDVLIIASPYLDVVQYHCERPVAVTFRMAPSDAAGMEQWYARLVDFNGGRIPSDQGYNAARAIERNFRRLSVEQYQALGKKYQGSYLLLRDRDDLPLPKRYENATWTLYDLQESAAAR